MSDKSHTTDSRNAVAGAVLQMQALDEAIQTWHSHAVQYSVHDENAPEGAKVLSEVYREKVDQAVVAYGDARQMECQQLGVIPLGWVDDAIRDALGGYLRRCSSGGMSKRQAELVQVHVEQMLERGYVKLLLAQRAIAAGGGAPGEPAA